MLLQVDDQLPVGVRRHGAGVEEYGEAHVYLFKKDQKSRQPLPTGRAKS